MLNIKTIVYAWIVISFGQLTSSERIIESKYLTPCIKQSQLGATSFHAVFSPRNRSLYLQIEGDSQIGSKVMMEITMSGYGYSILEQKLDPCDYQGLRGLCPMIAGNLPDLQANISISSNQINKIPNAVYYIPDLDGTVRAWINSSDDSSILTCLEAELSNGKTVLQTSISCILAIYASLFFVISALLWIKGFHGAAIQLYSKAFSLVGYYQSLGLFGMTAVHLPPIARAWSQNFQWCMGVIRLDVFEHFATWFLRSTGGNPNSILTSVATTSVRVQKRTNSGTYDTLNAANVNLRGIRRVSYLASIEITNFFLTCYIWFIIASLISALLIFTIRICLYILEKRVNSLNGQERKLTWNLYHKGLLFQLTFLSFVPLLVSSTFELSSRDSTTEQTIAAFTILYVLFLVGYSIYTILYTACRSEEEFGTAVYQLYTDNSMLIKWGFIYTQFRTGSLRFIIPIYVHLPLKSLFVSCGQGSPVAQAVGMFTLDLIFFLLISVFRPYALRSTNIWNIAISAIILLNSALLLLFSNMFGLSDLAMGVSGILFFFVNLIFPAILLFSLSSDAIRSVLGGNSYNCHIQLLDDRCSFIKPATNTSSDELLELGSVARGEFGNHLIHKSIPHSLRQLESLTTLTSDKT